jgi:hypothetical protein
MTPDQQNILKLLAQMGEVVYVKKDGSRVLLNEEGKVPLQTNADAVFYFLERLDSNMLNLILDKNLPYQDYEKKVFVKKLSYAFDELLSRGNTYLNRFEGKCTSNICTNVNCQGFSFVGNSSQDYMDLILEIKNNKVTDIFECSTFINSNTDILKKEKIYIDSLEAPF